MLVGSLRKKEGRQWPLVSPCLDSSLSTPLATCTAKKKEINSLTASIEAKMNESGDAGAAAVQMRNDFPDTTEGLTADLGFSADLGKGCDVDSPVD